jgi:tripartite ATP-independent transporter DctP family solute receptor
MARPGSFSNRRAFVRAASGLAGILALRRAPVFAQATPRKLILAANGPPPELSAAASAWFAKEVTDRSHGELQVDFQGGTLITKEIEVINAVKSGNVAMGSPIGAAATVFPEMGVFLVPYLVSSYEQAYRLFNGDVGDRLDRLFQEKYGVKTLYFFDLGFRHVWNSRRAIHEPKDLRGLKIRTQPSKIFADSINGLGGVAVPLPWAEVVTAAQQGVIDGGDLPVANMVPLMAFEFSKYYSLTFHNYGPTLMAMHLPTWKALRPDQQKLLVTTGREAQARLRHGIESVDSLAGARKLLEPHGMTVNEADVPAFRKLAQSRIWPAYERQYPELWQKIAASAR